MIFTLTPNTPEFDAYLWQAWGWTQERKAFYFRTGGYQAFRDYLRQAASENRKQFAIESDGGFFVSLITVEMFAKDAYEFHVTSCRGVDPHLVRESIAGLARDFFTKLNAEYLAVTVPKYNGHWHTGSKALAEFMDCIPDGEPEREDWVDGKIIEYQLYVLPKEVWLNGRRR